jgi:hypothetical protein
MHQWTKVQTICHFQGSFHIHFYIAFKIKKITRVTIWPTQSKS